MVYQGQGRYYDPALGRPLQPHPVGGPPLVPQGLNRYTATAVGQIGVLQAIINTWTPFSDPFISNTGKKVVSVSVNEVTAREVSAYFKASLYSLPGAPIWDDVTRAVPRSRLVDTVIFNAAVAGFVAQDLLGAPPGSLRARLFSRGQAMIEQAIGLNTRFVSQREIIGYEFRYAHRLPGGRLAGALASKLGLRALDLGIGLVVDVGYQAWLDYGNPYLTPIQFGLRLSTTGIGSGVSFLGGLGAGFVAAEWFGLGTVGIFGGPAGWVAIGSGVIISIAWDIVVAPFVYDFAELNPKRYLEPLRPQE